jgi:histidinol-phosphate aminotransferase
MPLDVLSLVRPEVRTLRPYVPGKPVEELERQLGIRSAIKLASNENPLGPSPRVLEAIQEAAKGANRYPDGGAYYLKERVAAFLGVTPAHLALGCGSNELIELLVHLFVGLDDEVVVSHPTFLMYGISVRLLGGRLVAVPGKGMEHDLDAMAAAVGPRTRMVIVCNPNNPTGAIVRRAAWERFLASVPERVVIVSDEAYFEYVEDPEYPETLAALALERPIVILRTFSKIHSLAGLRVGYGIARPELAQLFDRVRLPFNVSLVAQAAARAALEDPAHVERSRALVREGKPHLTRELTALGLTVHPSWANFLLVDMGRDVRPVCAALERRGVILRDLVPFGMAPQYVRVTVGTPEENRRFIEALTMVLRESPAGVA